jgi:hypothetical protein
VGDSVEGILLLVSFWMLHWCHRRKQLGEDKESLVGDRFQLDMAAVLWDLQSCKTEPECQS